MADDPAGVLQFWLEEVGPKGWYASSTSLDAQITDRFRDLWEAARGGGLDHWISGPTGSLAFLILTDQFPRNMFRGSEKAFSTDPIARDAATRAIADGWDREVPEPERQFFYLPFEHSEDMADQDRADELVASRMDGETAAETLLHARAHREVIRQYGRFPFRNAALGRENTPEETAFMERGAYGAFVRTMRRGPKAL